LSDTGELEEVTALYASTLPRAIETAEIIRDGLGGLVVVTDERLRELDPGQADNMSFTDYESTYLAEGAGRWSEDPTVPTAPGGESWARFVDRASRALHDLVDRHPDGTVVAACHGGIVEASMLEFLHMAGPYRFARFYTENASITEWSHKGNQWRLVRYNDTAHLAGLADR
jgi:broad specificity phosphatase PhoE